MNQKITRFSISFMIVLVLAAIACNKDQNIIEGPNMAKSYDSDIVSTWSQTLNQLIKNTEGYTYTTSARASAFVGLALYEAVLPGMPEYYTMAGQLNGLSSLPSTDNNKTYDWSLTANAAISEMTLHLFESSPAEMIQLIAETERNFQTSRIQKTALPSDVVSRSVAWGKELALTLIEFEKSDVEGHRAYERMYDPHYEMGDGDNVWKPEPPFFLPPVTPHWKNARPFSVKNSVAQPLPPTPFSLTIDSKFYNSALQVYQEVQENGIAQKSTIDFWNDMSPVISMGPAARWLSIASQVFEAENANLAHASVVFAKLSFALYDASITCWDSKYQYKVQRPVTYIREMIDPAFEPMAYAFQGPDYTSEHAVAAGVAYSILTNEFGTNYAFTDRCHENRTDIDGTPRSYSSFLEAAQEASTSRVMAGASFPESVDAGFKMGINVAQQTLGNLNWKY